MARPKLELDECQIIELAKIQCTMGEIAAVMGCSIDTLERRYAAIIKSGREQGKSSLRRRQYQAAMDGNAALLIWLGKQYLEQRDSPVDASSATIPQPIYAYTPVKTSA